MLWLPENETAEDLAFDDAIEHLAAAMEFRRTLKLIDERLDLCWAKPGATSVAVPERWYIFRRSDSGIGGMWMISNADGSYSDPDERHIAALMNQDAARHPDVWRRLEMGRRKAKEQAEKDKAETSRQFQSELLDRLDHLNNARIFVKEAAKAKLEAQPVLAG